MKEKILELAINNLLPIILTFALGAAGVIVKKALTTLKEVGEVLIAVSEAAADHKLTKAEITRIQNEAKDVISIWKKTPTVI